MTTMKRDQRQFVYLVQEIDHDYCGHIAVCKTVAGAKSEATKHYHVTGGRAKHLRWDGSMGGNGSLGSVGTARYFEIQRWELSG